ncbi:hypothetical protein HanXRQr2_Chr04g0173861 [Helianthus annuus]|uniref:Uncharacterized protein n=1 Tax=Helianthus annuus TaxID=4232 RepID=A0A251V1Z6_HELAN|nr:hypothetical protein HanXRQr2_Chr04g0173861 [Helianthus annuus]KAJ0931916.1 hypothetical protein HanPSC8_Chr04g0167501 [Helianthus annuus]
MKVRTPFGTCLPPCRRSEATSEATEATAGSTRYVRINRPFVLLDFSNPYSCVSSSDSYMQPM